MKLLKNILSLSLSQIGNYLLPLIVIPYLTRILGPSNFGLISFAQVAVGYLTIFINYGFDYTITREISVNRNSKEKIAQIFTHTLVLKTLLFIISTGILLSLFAFSKFAEHKLLFLITHLINIGFVLFPTWFFQGLEKLKITAILTFIIKLLFTIFTLIFVRYPEQYLLCNLFLSVSQILGGGLSIFIAIKYNDVYFTNINKQFLIRLIKEGSWLSLSTAIITCYTTSNILLLGILSTTEDLGYFNVAFKIVFAIHGILVVPFNLSFFPHVSRLFNNEVTQADKHLKRAMTYLAIITIPASLFLYTFSSNIILFFGAKFSPAIDVLKILAILPFLISMVNVFGMNGLIAMKKDKTFVKVTAVGALVNIALNLMLIPKYGMLATAWIWVATESIIFIGSYFFYRKYINKLIIA